MILSARLQRDTVVSIGVAFRTITPYPHSCVTPKTHHRVTASSSAVSADITPPLELPNAERPPKTRKISYPLLQ